MHDQIHPSHLTPRPARADGGLPHSFGDGRPASPGHTLLEELLAIARRSRLMINDNDTTHHAIPPPAGMSQAAGFGLVTAATSASEESRTWRGRFTTRDPGPAAALLEELAVGDAEIARELQQLERRAIASMADDLGSGALPELQQAAFSVRKRLMVTLSKAMELQENKKKY